MNLNMVCPYDIYETCKHSSMATHSNKKNISLHNYTTQKQPWPMDKHVQFEIDVHQQIL